jgi:thiol-disulfide isomerase/thioredoxin
MRPDLSVPPPEPEAMDDIEPVGGATRPIWLVALLVAVGLGLAGWKVLGPSGDRWLHDLGAGIDAAEASGKPMFVLYTADWCPPCRQLFFNDTATTEIYTFLREEYVLVKIDLTSRGGPNARTAGEYGVTGIPTVILYDRAGLEVDRVTGGAALAHWIQKQAAY